MSRRKPVDLRQAAAIIFALVAILPLMVFVFLLSGAGLLMRTEAQVGLLLAVVIALLGYAVFQRLVGRVSHLIRALEGGQGASPAAVVPGLGSVSELGEMAHAFSRMLQELRASTERLEDLVFKLGTLNEMVEVAAKIPRIQDLLADVLERTMRAVRAKIGSIMLLDADRQVLRVVVARGLPAGVEGQAEVPVGEGVAGKVVQFGDPVLVEDIENDPRFAKVSDPRYGSGSFICFPLRVAERVIGVVNLARKEAIAGSASPFGQTDVQFLNTLMTYTAYAVDNARLLEEAQGAARRLNEVVEDQKLRLTLAQQQMLQAAKLSALGELVAGVAHELNNPLTVLAGMGELLADEIPETSERIRAMQHAIDRAGRVVQGLLTFARQRTLQRQRVDLAALVERTLALTAADLRLAGVVVETDVPADLPTIWADPHQLEQVLVNLVTNARQAMADVEGKRGLRISVRPEAREQVSIVVEDTGPGIAAELIPTVFDPFVSTKGGQGTGLGLSISYGIMREHGGSIRVESEPGQGARFTIELPHGTPVTEAPPARAAEPGLTGRRVLVVEDDELVRDILQRHLQRAGCATVCTVSAEDALARVHEPFDLILSDFYLPGMNGLALLREAMAREPTLRARFLFVSGGPVPEAAQQAFGRRKAGVLPKPFTRRQLLEAVGDALA